MDEVAVKTVCITKGDANNANNTGYIENEDILGKMVFTIPWLDRISMWMHS